MGAVQGGLCPEKPFPFHHRAIIIFYEFCDTKSLGSVVCESGCIRSFILSFRKQFLRASLAGGGVLGSREAHSAGQSRGGLGSACCLQDQGDRVNMESLSPGLP